MPRFPSIAASFLVCFCCASVAQDWTARFDLLTAGAAASVITYQICKGGGAGKQAAERASQRLAAEANNMSRLGIPAATAYNYSSDSYSLKIKAMWQANASSSCSDLKRLRDIAASTGFDLPN